jgi:hypothetical protein
MGNGRKDGGIMSESENSLENLNLVIEDLRKLQDGGEFDRHDYEAMIELLNETYNYLVVIGA